MGCVKSRKLGTADPIVYFGQFGKQINEAQLFGIMLLAEHYLMKVLKQGTSCTNMDDLHYWQYHHSKNQIIEQLPPTLRETRLHIMRSIYATHVHMNCLTGASLDP